MTPCQAVILFLRVPEKGRVKTRLSARLDERFVLDLYKAFVKDMLIALQNLEPIYLFFWPPDKKEELVQWLGREYQYLPQQRGNLGEKMAAAFEYVFSQGADQALVAGTDIPELNRQRIDDALGSLRKNDAVIGPCHDGGYYLIGFDKAGYSRDFFSGITWSTSQVLEQTLDAMNEKSIQYHLLEELADIDTPEEMERLIQRLKNGGRVGRQTMGVLNAYDR